jgi:hypothetical protein
MINMHINPDLKYGLDHQEIHFEPNCDFPIGEGDVIVADKTALYCVRKNTFVIWDNSVDFITGYHLLSKKFSILSY